MTEYEFEPYDWPSDALVPVLLADWTEPELRLLHATLRGLGSDGWWGWLKANSADAARHLSDGKPRRKRPPPGGQTHALLVRYGALWLAQLGRHAMLHFDDPFLYQNFGTLRQRRAARGELLVDLCGWVPEAWLWKQPADLGDPFA